MSTLPQSGKEIRLAARPEAEPSHENFDLVDAAVAEPGEGQILVRNTMMSVDPYMRGRMNEGPSYVRAFEVGQPLDGAAIGEVIMSHAPEFEVGQTVLHPLGWREYATVRAKHATPIPDDGTPARTRLGVLGMPGLTAYGGLFHFANFTEGDAVFVSAAAGAVGSMAGQLAKLGGASRVVGSAGSAEKVRHLTEDLGFDAAFNYKDGPVGEQLAQAAPDGIDVYFDNVGGEQLEAALDAMHDFGRIAACGAVSQYNRSEPAPGPRNMMFFVAKRLSMRGFIIGDHPHLRSEFEDKVAPWVRDGRVHYQETIVDGIENAPDAFMGMLRGENTGKMLVRIG